MSSPVVVLFGGPSDERRVSTATTQHVLAVLGDAQPWFVGRDLRLFKPAREDVLAHGQPFTSEFEPRGAPAAASLDEALRDPALSKDTVFFLGMHGSWGEDGTVQKLLEARGFAFTGSGSRASADAFEKTAAKRIASARGVRIAESRELPRDAPGVARVLRDLLGKHGRVVAKPIAGGSSVGLHHVRAPDEVDRAAVAIAAHGEPYLAEEFIRGTELTVGIVDGPAGTRALPVSEVRVDPGRAFDYEGKYLGKGTIEITPAEVPAEVAKAAQQLAMTAHQALGCTGYSRTDVIADEQGPVYLETNTLPGLTRASFIPQQLAAEGTPMAQFLAEQLELARRRPR